MLEGSRPRPRAARPRPLIIPVIALVLVACSGAPPGTERPSSTPSAPPSAVPVAPVGPSASPGEPAAPGEGGGTVHPVSSPVEVGAAEVLTVFTHCGFQGSLDWGGSFWREVARSPEGGAIGDPEDTGRVTLLSPTSAKFESSTGTVVALERIDGPIERVFCD